MTRATRRVVTGHDTDGKAIVLSDAPAPNVKVRQTGITSTLLWVTDESPADISGSADRAARESGVAPPANGSILRIVDFPPVTADAVALGQAAMHKEMGLHGASTGAGARHAFTHRTKSIDYALVLEGEIDMLLDDSEIHLKAGDVLIQQGTNHAWVNRGTEPCRIAFILIDSKEP
jgi:mannose-6-phosphate isomerase-like protein (cupin superfamily)